MPFVVLEQRVGELGEPEEVVRLVQHLDGPVVDRALAVDQIAGTLELLASHAVGTLEVRLIDMTVVLQRLPELLHTEAVALTGRTDEVVVGGVDRLQHRLPGILDEPVAPDLRLHPVVPRRALDLGAVLVGAREVEHRFLALPAPTGQHIAGHRRVGVTDVWGVVDVVNGRRDVERLGHVESPGWTRSSLGGGMRDHPRDGVTGRTVTTSPHHPRAV